MYLMNHYFLKTLKENLTEFTDKVFTDKELIEILGNVCFNRKGNKSKELLHEDIGENANLLSSGQKQRLAIGRALTSEIMPKY